MSETPPPPPPGFVSRYGMNNIVIVPNDPSKPNALEQQQKSDEKLINEDVNQNVADVKDLNKTKKVYSWASNYLQSIGHNNLKPIKINISSSKNKTPTKATTGAGSKGKAKPDHINYPLDANKQLDVHVEGTPRFCGAEKIIAPIPNSCMVDTIYSNGNNAIAPAYATLLAARAGASTYYYHTEKHSIDIFDAIKAKINSEFDIERNTGMMNLPNHKEMCEKFIKEISNTPKKRKADYSKSSSTKGEKSKMSESPSEKSKTPKRKADCSRSSSSSKREKSEQYESPSQISKSPKRKADYSRSSSSSKREKSEMSESPSQKSKTPKRKADFSKSSSSTKREESEQSESPSPAKKKTKTTESVKEIEKPTDKNKKNKNSEADRVKKSKSQHNTATADTKKLKRVQKVFEIPEITSHSSRQSVVNKQSVDENNDLRSKLSRVNERIKIRNCYLERLKDTNSKLNTPMDNLKITIDNPIPEKQKSIEKFSDFKPKSKKCKKLKLIINVVCKETDDDSSSNDSNLSENENNQTPNMDLSFLDDINVDEIVDSLKHSPQKKTAHENSVRKEIEPDLNLSKILSIINAKSEAYKNKNLETSKANSVTSTGPSFVSHAAIKDVAAEDNKIQNPQTLAQNTHALEKLLTQSKLQLDQQNTVPHEQTPYLSSSRKELSNINTIGNINKTDIDEISDEYKVKDECFKLHKIEESSACKIQFKENIIDDDISIINNYNEEDIKEHKYHSDIKNHKKTEESQKVYKCVEGVKEIKNTEESAIIIEDNVEKKLKNIDLTCEISVSNTPKAFIIDLTADSTDDEMTSNITATSKAPFIKTTPTSMEPLIKATPTSMELLIEATPTSKEPLIKTTQTSMEPLIKATSTSKEPLIKATQTSMEPLIKATPTSNEPFIKTTQTSMVPLIKATPTSKEPFIKTTPTSKEPFIKTAPTSKEPLIKATPTSMEPLIKATPTSNEPLINTTQTSMEPLFKATATSKEPFIKTTPTFPEPLIKATQTSMESLIRATPTSMKPLINATTTSNEPLIKTAQTSMKPLIKATPTSKEPLIKATQTSMEPLINATPTFNEPLIKTAQTSMEPLINATTSNEPLIKIAQTSMEPLIKATPTSKKPLIKATQTSMEPLIKATPTSMKPLINATPTFNEPLTKTAQTSMERMIEATPTSKESLIKATPTSMELLIEATPTSKEPLIKTTQTSMEPLTKETPTSNEPLIKTAQTSMEPLIKATPTSKEPLIKATQTSMEPLIKATPTSMKPLINATPTFNEPLTKTAQTSMEPMIEATPTSKEPLMKATQTSMEPLMKATPTSIEPTTQPKIQLPLIKRRKAVKNKEPIKKTLPTNTILIEKTMEKNLHIRMKIIKCIHTGRFSKIFRCIDPSGQLYIAKLLKNKSLQKQEKMLKKLQQDIPQQNLNTVFLLDGFAIKTEWCLIMEYYPKTLKEALDAQVNKKPFPIYKVQDLARQLISALMLFRNIEIVHSGINPSHILLSANQERLKICGFDRAYYINESRPIPNIASPNYRAPEVILGFSAGYSVDIWASALVIYEMATNLLLFKGIFNNDILYQQMSTFSDLPWDMVETSRYGNQHFRGETFMRRFGVRGELSVPIYKFYKSNRMPESIISTNKEHWFAKNDFQRNSDTYKLNALINLLEQMLVLDPRKRLATEFVLLHPFISDIL